MSTQSESISNAPGSRFRIRSFAFLGLIRTRHGAELIRQVTQAGLRPKCVLVQAETDYQVEIAEEYYSSVWWRWPLLSRRIGKRLILAAGPKSDESLPHLCLERRIPFLYVRHFNDVVSADLLVKSNVDTAVLAETPIIKGPILKALRQPLINLHAAPLPGYRGSYATYWALYHDEPLTVSAHFVESEVDTGDLLGSAELPVFYGDRLQDIDRRGFHVCGELATKVLHKAMLDGISPIPQKSWQGQTFRGQMPEEIIDELNNRISQGEYTFMREKS